MEGDLEKATELLKDIRGTCEDVTNHMNDLCSKVSHGDINTSKGISFLEVKYQMLLSYLVNLTYILLKKSCGQSIRGDEAVERLVEIRTVLEKMRPIDQKLKYQVDKVIRLAATGGGASDDPMRFKANPDSLESKLDDDSGSGSESEEEEESSSKTYKPPKLAPVHYDGDETAPNKKQKQLETMRKRALNSDILRDLRDQYHDGPEEIRETTDLHRIKENKRQKDKTRYEEENFMRLMVTKKDKAAQKQLGTISSLNSLTHFGSISALDMDGDMQEIPAKRRKSDGKQKSKGKKGKKGGKKGFKKRRRH